MNFNIQLFVFILSISFTLQQDQYKYLSYNDILNKFSQMQKNYPNLIKVSEAKEESGIKNIRKTDCNGNNCEHIYAEVTNFENQNYKQLPQVFLTGSFHGDEYLGPSVLTHLLQYIFNNKDDRYFSDLLNTKMLIVLPISNPSGYSKIKREEYDLQGYSIDMNRDFPYNNTPNKCFKTAGARVINYLFNKYIIQAGITFHGGMYAIGYPWGSNNHSSNRGKVGDLAPDNQALKIIGQFMKKMSPGNKQLGIKEYPVDTLTNGIYAVPGTLEDWAYCASWEPQVTGNQQLLAKCNDISEEELKVQPEAAKALFYLIEASDQKKPFENTLGSYQATMDPNSNQFGHIPRNIMASLAIIESVKPQVYIKQVENLGNYQLNIQWQVLGCSNVDSHTLYYRQYEVSSNKHTYQMQDVSEVKQLMKVQKLYQNQPGKMQDQEYFFDQTIQLDFEQEIEIAFDIQCDQQQFSAQDNPKPYVQPQSHIVRSRLDENYKIENQNGFSVTSSKIVLDNQQPIYKVTNEAGLEQGYIPYPYSKSQQNINDQNIDPLQDTQSDNNNNQVDNKEDNLENNQNSENQQENLTNNNDYNDENDIDSQNNDNSEKNNTQNLIPEQTTEQQSNQIKQNKNNQSEQRNPQNEDISFVGIVLIGMAIILAVILIAGVLRKLCGDPESSTKFIQMDQKLRKNENRNLQIDLGVSNTDVENLGDVKEEQVDNDLKQNPQQFVIE